MARDDLCQNIYPCSQSHDFPSHVSNHGNRKSFWWSWKTRLCSIKLDMAMKQEFKNLLSFLSTRNVYFIVKCKVHMHVVVCSGWLLTSREDTPSDRLTDGWLTGSEKAGLHQHGAGLQICKAKTVSGLPECWQCDCSVRSAETAHSQRWHSAILANNLQAAQAHDLVASYVTVLITKWHWH